MMQHLKEKKGLNVESSSSEARNGPKSPGLSREKDDCSGVFRGDRAALRDQLLAALKVAFTAHDAAAKAERTREIAEMLRTQDYERIHARYPEAFEGGAE